MTDRSRPAASAAVRGAQVVSLPAAGPQRRGSKRRSSSAVLTYNIHHGEGLDGRFDLSRRPTIITSAAADLIALQEVDRGTQAHQRRGSARGAGTAHRHARRLRQGHGLSGRRVRRGGAVPHADSAGGNRRLPGSPDREPRTALTVDVDARPHGGRGSSSPPPTLDQGRDLMDQVAQASCPRRRLVRAGAGRHPGRRPEHPVRHAGRCRFWRGDGPIRSSIHLRIPNGRPRRRVDYVMVRHRASWRTVESRYIDAPLASDHQPVLVVLEWIGNTSGRRAATR